jgi:hypothetical protein
MGAASEMYLGIVVSAGMNLRSELTGGMEANVEDLAEQFADRAVAFYEEQAWR